jgi:hypothetical protein
VAPGLTCVTTPVTTHKDVLPPCYAMLCYAMLCYVTSEPCSFTVGAAFTLDDGCWCSTQRSPAATVPAQELLYLRDNSGTMPDCEHRMERSICPFCNKFADPFQLAEEKRLRAEEVAAREKKAAAEKAVAAAAKAAAQAAKAQAAQDRAIIRQRVSQVLTICHHVLFCPCCCLRWLCCPRQKHREHTRNVHGHVHPHWRDPSPANGGYGQ